VNIPISLLKYRANLHSVTAHPVWREQFNALFMLDPMISRNCQFCQASYPIYGTDGANPRMGLMAVQILESGTDALRAALIRTLNSHLPQLKCKNCGHHEIKERLRIEGAPEILRIGIQTNLDYDADLGDCPKKTTILRIPQTLVMTQFLKASEAGIIKYHLSSVLPHHGQTMSSGHWVAAVRGPKKFFAINDDQCVARPHSLLASSPLQFDDLPSCDKSTRSGYAAALLIYVRHHPKQLKRNDNTDYDRLIENLSE
jgi:hypothetical protein